MLFKEEDLEEHISKVKPHNTRTKNVLVSILMIIYDTDCNLNMLLYICIAKRLDEH